MIAKTPRRQFDEDRLKANATSGRRTSQAITEGIERESQRRIEQGIQQGKANRTNRLWFKCSEISLATSRLG